MNKDILQGSWLELKGKVKKQWCELTEDKIGQMEGKTEELHGYLQKKYGYRRDKILDEIDNFLAEIRQRED